MGQWETPHSIPQPQHTHSPAMICRWSLLQQQLLSAKQGLQDPPDHHHHRRRHHLCPSRPHATATCISMSHCLTCHNISSTIPRGAHPSTAGHTQLSRVTPPAWAQRLSLNDEGRLTHLTSGGAQHLDQTRMGLEPIQPATLRHWSAPPATAKQPKG
jgi:hypothetical protein